MSRKNFRVQLLFLIIFISLAGLAYARFEKPIRPEKPSRKLICPEFILSPPKIKDPKRLEKYHQRLKRRFAHCFPLIKLQQISQSGDENFIISLLNSDLLSQEITQTFGSDAFAQAQTNAEEIINITADPEVTILGEWMETHITIQTEHSTQTYLAVFHLEDGEWKLFGTEEID